MKLYKPTWVTHEEKAIFSVDFHKNGTKFATGGLSKNSTMGLVNIWSMECVWDEEKELTEKNNKLLCSMDNHLGCVNCVRFSNNGNYLASCSDDRLIMIWKQRNRVSSFSQNNVKYAEEWRCCNILRYHQGDVLHVSWSPDDVHLASASIDNDIAVWDAVKFPNIITTLKAHKGMVKGVSWDPTGTYLASQSDDRTVIIWRVDSWKCCGTTHVLRLDWSPDGMSLVSAHAINNGGPTSQIIERSSWNAKTDFVGHRKAINVIRFNSRMFYRDSNSTEDGESSQQTLKINYNCVLAIGSKDRSLSIWLSGCKRPLVVIHDLFDNSIMDLTWSKDGYSLIASSFDGTVAHLNFTVDELGIALSDDIQMQILKGYYGENLYNIKDNCINDTTMIPESVELYSDYKKFESKNIAIKKVKSVKIISIESNKTQTETVTKDGKRRIRPICIDDEDDERCEIISTKIIDKIIPNDQPSLPDLSVDLIKKTDNQIKQTKRKATFHNYLKIKKVRSNNGTETLEKDEIKKQMSNVQDVIENSDKITHQVFPDLEPIDEIVISDGQNESCTKSGDTNSIDSSTGSQISCSDDIDSFIDNVKPLNILASLKPLKCFKKYICNKKTITCTNMSAASKYKASIVVLLEYEVEKFKILLPGMVTAVEMSSLVLAIVCSDQSVHVFNSENGFRLLPALMAKHEISIVKVNGNFVLIVTKKLFIHLWDIASKKCVFATSAKYLAKDNNFTGAHVTEKGVLVLFFSHQSAYIFNIRLDTWIQVNSKNDIRYLFSDNVSLIVENSVLDLILSTKMKNTNGPINEIVSMFESNINVDNLACSSFIENRLCLHEFSSLKEEYFSWLIVYVKFLSKKDDACNLRNLLHHIYKNITIFDSISIDKNRIIEKIKLIRNLMVHIHPNCQRIYSEFESILGAYEASIN